LQHVLSLASVIQYTEAKAEKLRGGHFIDEAEREAIAARDAMQCCDELPPPSLGIHCDTPLEG